MRYWDLVSQSTQRTAPCLCTRWLGQGCAHFWLGVRDFGPPAPELPEKRNLRLATVCENPALGHPSKKPAAEQGENRKARLNCLNHSTKSLVVPAAVGADAGG